MNTVRFFTLLCAVTFMGPIFAGPVYSALVNSPAYSIIVNAMESTPFEDGRQELLTENHKLAQRLREANGRIAQLSSTENMPHVDLHKYARRLEAFIEEPEDSFDSLDETLTEYQKHIRGLARARSHRATEPRELSGILLSGPPGTGKTRFAGALAREANLPFCHLGASFFNEGFGGEGSSLARSLLLLAQKYSERRNGKNPGILIFIDEIDILAKKRNSSGGGFVQNMQTTTASLWKTLDKISRKCKRTVVVAATNKPENCDAAIMGRFHKLVEFDPPTVAQLFSALNYHMKHMWRLGYRYGKITLPLNNHQQILSFRSMKNLVDEACDYADAEQTKQLTQEHFSKALKKILELEQRKTKLSEDEERRQREIEAHKWQKQGLELQQISQQLQERGLEIQEDSRALQHHPMGLVGKTIYYVGKTMYDAIM